MKVRNYKQVYRGKPTLMLNFFRIRVRNKPRYAPVVMAKETARYRKWCFLVAIKAIKLRMTPIVRRK